MDKRVELYLARALNKKGGVWVAQTHRNGVLGSVKVVEGVVVTGNCQLSTDNCEGLTVMGSSD